MKRLWLASFLFFTSFAAADNQPTGSQTQVISDFSGGLNTNDPSHKLDTSFSPFMRNVFVDNGKIERVNGFSTVGSTMVLKSVTGVFPFVQEDGTTKFLVTDSSITFQTSDFASWVLVSSAASSLALLNWMQVRNKMWGFNGVDFVIVWDGVNKTILNGNPTPAGATTPNVPKFRYGAYFDDRVWGLNVPNAASDLYFTSVITTDAVIIAPDDARAWPAINLLHIGQGDGQVGTALFVSDGQLRVGKERSIHTIFGDSPSSFGPRKENTDIGVASNDSVAVVDGQAHFLSKDGIYRNSTRISDLIRPDVETFYSLANGTVQNIWDAQNDFDKGQYDQSISSVSGVVKLFKGRNVTVNQSAQRIPDYFVNSFITSDSTFYYTIPSFTNDNRWLSSENFFYVQKIRVPLTAAALGVAARIRATLTNKFTGLQQTTVTTVNNTAGPVEFIFSSHTLTFQAFHILQSSLSLNLEWDNKAEPLAAGVVMQSPEAATGWRFDFLGETTGQYISQVATNTTITSWQTFESNNNTNGGTINYYIRSSTSVVNITTQTWQSINPGVTIPFSTLNRFVQWASTLTATVSFSGEPEITNAFVNHLEGGGAISRAAGINWKNRYWLSVSTSSNASDRVIYVKSKSTNKNPDAWMPIQDVPICSFARNGDILYGGMCSTGIVVRLDNGTNFNGVPIQSIYDTPDMVLGDPYFDKELSRYILDGQKSPGGTLTVGTSVDQMSFSNESFSIDGTNRYSKVRNKIGTHGKTVRLRLTNMELDKTFKINSVGVIYKRSEVLSEK